MYNFKTYYLQILKDKFGIYYFKFNFVKVISININHCSDVEHIALSFHESEVDNHVFFGPFFSFFSNRDHQNFYSYSHQLTKVKERGLYFHVF